MHPSECLRDIATDRVAEKNGIRYLRFIEQRRTVVECIFCRESRARGKCRLAVRSKIPLRDARANGDERVGLVVEHGVIEPAPWMKTTAGDPAPEPLYAMLAVGRCSTRSCVTMSRRYQSLLLAQCVTTGIAAGALTTASRQAPRRVHTRWPRRGVLLRHQTH